MRAGRRACILSLALIAAGCGARRASPSVDPPAAARVEPVQQLQRDLTAILQTAGVQRATWGIAVESLASKERLFELNPRALLVPASSAKLVSLAAAVDAVGWDFRFETALAVTGTIVEGVTQTPCSSACLPLP